MRKGPETSKARNLLGRSGARGKPPGPVCISDDLELPHGLERGAGHPTLPSPRTRRLAFLPWTQLNIFIEASGMGGLGGSPPVVQGGQEAPGLLPCRLTPQAPCLHTLCGQQRKEQLWSSPRGGKGGVQQQE